MWTTNFRASRAVWVALILWIWVNGCAPREEREDGSSAEVQQKLSRFADRLDTLRQEQRIPGLSVAVMAGLSFGTLLTMFLVPVLYATVYRLRSDGGPASPAGG